MKHFRTLALIFRKLNLMDRACVVRHILLAVGTLSHMQNTLDEDMSADEYKKRKTCCSNSLADDDKHQSSVVYSRLGIHLCRAAFAAVVGLKEKIVEPHARRVLDGPIYMLYVPQCADRRTAKLGIQLVVVSAFLS